MTPTAWLDSAANLLDTVVNKGLPLFGGSLDPIQYYLGISVAPKTQLRYGE